MDREIEKFALFNALKFDGKANPGAVLGQLFSENPKLKNEIKEISKKVQEAVKKVNSMSLEQQKEALESIAPELLHEKKEKKKRELAELPHVTGPVVTRIPPEPSKYPHLGHALSFLLNYMYAQKYHGKCVLRIDDTNPEKAKKEYYDAIHDALVWLRIEPDRIIVASEEMGTFYKYAEELIKKESAYVCFCDKEKISDYRTHAKICDHRVQHERKNMEEWNAMLAGKYKAGEATLRLVGEIDSLNATMRDPVLFRIVHHAHPLVKDKYLVWPMYDFETVIGEEIAGVTHILRSIEFGSMRVELQNYIKDLLGFKKQEVLQYGRFSVNGFDTQGRVIRERIEKGEVDGWDDPRLMTLMALRRRGIVPETFYELVLEVGLSATATNLDWSQVAAINRKLIDPIARRYFFVKGGKIITVKNDLKKATVPLHPEFKEMGTRTVAFDTDFYVQDDIPRGQMYRFMHLFNFENGAYVSEAYDASLKAKIIHCVPVKDAVPVQVLMDDGSVLEGHGEKALKDLKEGDIIQFERMFFCRLDNKKKMLFVYAHD
ncbi:glutamate--tRNA ligase [Candidatus Woesearchaeota archaeon]|nr:glutamate--tRNA ligase [Candidatus Woesearchaeota archaeon]